jgi:hypothetical protein
MNIRLPKIVLIAAVTVLLVTSLPTRAQYAQQSKPDKRLQAIQLLHLPDGLHKAALANGGTFDTGPDSPPISRAAGLPDLVSSSTLIVSAKVQSSESKLIDEGRDIATIYSLQIARTFKGENSGQVSLAVKGGTYTFPDGSKAMHTEDLCRPLVQDVEYILFLVRYPDPSDLNLYYEAGRCESVFEVARDGHHLYSHTYMNEDHLRGEAKAGKQAFVQRLQSIISTQQSTK